MDENQINDNLFEEYSDITQEIDQQQVQQDQPVPDMTQMPQGTVPNDKGLVLNTDQLFPMDGSRLPSLDFGVQDYEDDASFADMLKKMSSKNGYSIVLVILHLLVMLGIGTSLFFILYSVI